MNRRVAVIRRMKEEREREREISYILFKQRHSKLYKEFDEK